DIVQFHNREQKNVLVVEDNELDSSQIAKMLKGDGVQISVANTGKKAIKLLEAKEYDCIILDYTLPDISGTELVEKVSEIKQKLTPVIVYSAKDFNKAELNQLAKTSSTVLLKGVNSLEHLLEETVLHLHVNFKDLAPEKKKILQNIRMKEDILTGKNILVVDDDVRN